MKTKDPECNYLGINDSSLLVNFKPSAYKGHVLIIGSSGTGMSCSFIFPSESALKNKNYVVTDPRSESGDLLE